MCPISLCTKDQLIAAFNLLVERSEAKELADEFFEMHNEERDESPDLLKWAPWVQPKAPPSLAELAQQGVIYTVGRARESPPWSYFVRSLPRQMRKDLLLTFTPETLDLIALVSDELAERVQRVMSYSSEHMKERRERMLAGIEAPWPPE